MASQAHRTKRSDRPHTIAGAGRTSQSVRSARSRLRALDQHLWHENLEKEAQEIVQNQGECRIRQSRFGVVRGGDANAAVQAKDPGFGGRAGRWPTHAKKSLDQQRSDEVRLDYPA